MQSANKQGVMVGTSSSVDNIDGEIGKYMAGD